MATEGRLEAIVLAAGSGARFGGGKLLAPYAGATVLDGALAAAFAAPVRRVTVVTGADPRVEAAAVQSATAWGQRERLCVVHAADHLDGMAASLRAGLAALPTDADGAFVLLGDMPRVPSAIFRPMAAALANGAQAAAPHFAGRRGNPVLLGAGLFEAARRLGGDRGARTLLDGLGDRLALVEAPDNGVLFDIDLPEHLDP